MKSSKYEILPRVRFRHGIDELPWVCTWKDPGKLIQREGKSLRYVAAYVGYGETMEEAINDCQTQYAEVLVLRDKCERNFEEFMRQVGDVFPEAPAHCIATSKLPWWKRLFRV